MPNTLRASGNRSARVALSLAALLAAAPALASDWPIWRGSRFAGVGGEKGVVPDAAVGLRVAWKKPLGTGYASVVIADGTAVTFFGDAQNDMVVALDLATGRERWRAVVGPLYKGGLAGSGSADGASGTPSIADGVVYALSPLGKLLALRLEDGREVWSRDVAANDGAKPPGAGFTTTPTVAGEALVVMTGGDQGRSLTGYDRKTGARLWSTGDDTVGYQSPIVAPLAGKVQVIAMTEREIAGVDPSSGRTLWRQKIERRGEDGSMSHVVPAGDDHLLLVTRNVGASLLRFEPAPDGGRLVEVWKAMALGATYGLPVIHEGYIYGYTGRFLTCLDLKTGQQVWKSRPPGGRNLILVDSHLFTVSTEGEMVVARATPRGYEERARLKVTADTSEATPAFSKGLLVFRNLSEIAAVAITDRATRAAAASSVAGGPGENTAFGAFVRQVEAAPESERAARIDAFMRNQQSFPIVEGDRLVHFVYRGPATDVALNGSMTDVYPGDASEPLARVAGTDFFHRTFELAPGSRWDYRFVIDFKPFTLDPLNPRRVPERRGRGELNEVVLPGYPAPWFIEPPGPGVPRGTIDEIVLRSAVMGKDRRVKVYRPPGYEGPSSVARYPLLVVANGYQSLDLMKLDNVFDNLIAAKTVAPFIAAMPEFNGIPEEAGEATPRLMMMVIDELVPHVDLRYRTLARPESRAIMGAFRGATGPFIVAGTMPGTFSKIGLTSLYLIPPYDADVMKALSAGKQPVEFFLEWNRYEQNSKELNVDLREHGRRFAKLLDDHRYRWTGGEANDASGWASWRARLDKQLSFFFPPR